MKLYKKIILFSVSIWYFLQPLLFLYFSLYISTITLKWLFCCFRSAACFCQPTPYSLPLHPSASITYCGATATATTSFNHSAVARPNSTEGHASPYWRTNKQSTALAQLTLPRCGQRKGRVGSGKILGSHPATSETATEMEMRQRQVWTTVLLSHKN